MEGSESFVVLVLQAAVDDDGRGRTVIALGDFSMCGVLLVCLGGCGEDQLVPLGVYREGGKLGWGVDGEVFMLGSACAPIEGRLCWSIVD